MTPDLIGIFSFGFVVGVILSITAAVLRERRAKKDRERLMRFMNK